MKKTFIAAVVSLFAITLDTSAGFADDNPTGLPGNPTTNENVIPGPETTNPTDPAAADSFAARVPTTESERKALHKEKAESKHMKREADAAAETHPRVAIPPK